MRLITYLCKGVNDMVLFRLFIIVVLLPVSASFMFYKWLKKLLWCVPVFTLIITGYIFYKEISVINEKGFGGKLKFYFSQDWSMGFTLIILPTIIMAFVSTIAFYLYDYFKKHSQH
jgi:hypothetical protein